MELVPGLNVEHEDADLQRVLDLVAPFADAGIDDFLGVNAGAQGAKELSAGYDICSSPFPSEQSQDGAVRIGLQGVADDAWYAREGAVEGPEVVHKRIAAVKIERSADPLGHVPDRNPFTIQLAFFILEIVHNAFRAKEKNQRNSSAEIFQEQCFLLMLSQLLDVYFFFFRWLTFVA
jgi:hypothetical protein